MSQVFYYSSTSSPDEIEKAYAAGTAKLGFNFCEEVCEGYEERIMCAEHLAILRQCGYSAPLDMYDGEDENGYGDAFLRPEDFADIYLFIVGLGNPSFQYEAIKPPNINIGGYGLFCP